jgi:hypothetical protein
MQKTIKEWLETIKDENTRQRALANSYPELENDYSDSLADALSNSFVWGNSPEGFNFWYDFVSACRAYENSSVSKTGIEEISEERQEQISKHGFNSTNDAKYSDGQLLTAAICYLYNEVNGWPWGTDTFKCGNRIKQLRRAGALIAAEIDRLKALQMPASDTDLPDMIFTDTRP